ncbi:5034_t:CDS:2, partial [Ambispora gerdemannii]
LKLRARADQNYERDGCMSEGIAKQKIKRERVFELSETMTSVEKVGQSVEI